MILSCSISGRAEAYWDGCRGLHTGDSDFIILGEEEAESLLCAQVDN